MTRHYPVPAELKKAAARILETNSEEMDEVFCICPGRWTDGIPGDADVQRLAKKFRGEISRDKVVKCAPKAKPTQQQLRRLFIATMMWGYNKIGYGPSRTSEMLNSHGLEEALSAAYGHIIAGEWQAAISDCAVIQQCGVSFFSKFLYFVGRAYETETMPLILDALVCDELYRCAKKLARKVASKKRTDRRGFITEFRTYKDGYALYVEVINQWAHHLKVKPDQLEFFLFTKNACRRQHVKRRQQQTD